MAGTAVSAGTTVAVPGRSFDAWRSVARLLLMQGVPPQQVAWRDAGAVQTDLPPIRWATAHPFRAGCHLHPAVHARYRPPS